MGKGRSLELYFIDGKPDGMLTAEVFNWTGHVLMTPRTRIIDALKRGEAGYTGVYILLGETEDGPLAYIGEAEDLGSRLRGHVKGKDWWETAVLITSTANNLHKAHVKYLESRLVEMALVTKRMPLDNGNAPPRSSLSESATANMEEFLDTLMMVLPAIQVDMFVNKAELVSNSLLDKPKQAMQAGRTALFELRTPKHGVIATAEFIGGEMVVQAGSVGRSEWLRKHGHNEGYRQLHTELLQNGVLRPLGKNAEFTKSYAFSSPSAAAAILNARAANGRREWKLKGTNTTYAEWEAAQLDQMDTE
ncbi:MAG: GIY-YIG nuclease family protein [Marinosulfonomonas sp.]|nr:GIY-YIG nuclease family protein [Marinosulfonomonas sp.]